MRDRKWVCSWPVGQWCKCPGPLLGLPVLPPSPNPAGATGGCLAWTGSEIPEWPPSGLVLCSPLARGEEVAARDGREAAHLFLTSCLCTTPRDLDPGSGAGWSGLGFRPHLWPYFPGNPTRLKHGHIANVLSSRGRSGKNNLRQESRRARLHLDVPNPYPCPST